MSLWYWQDQLKSKLKPKPGDPCPFRIAVVGIGNALRGDDGVGVCLARELNKKFADTPELMILDAGVTPENITNRLRRHNPALILLIDAAQMNETPGTIALWSAEENSGTPFSTHSLPIRMLCKYLTAELDCEIVLLGIQPADISFTQELSPLVKQAERQVVSFLGGLLGRLINPNLADTQRLGQVAFKTGEQAAQKNGPGIVEKEWMNL